MKSFNKTNAGIFALALTASIFGSTVAKADLVMKLKCGDVHIKTFDTLAPAHVKQIEILANKGFYNGIIFHRVIAGFMAQTGDPTGTGTGGSSLPNIKAEFNNVPFERSIVGMARSSSPNSANSQFFFMFNKNYGLNGKYTAWGKVTKGMECIDKINKGEPPASPDKIIKLSVAKSSSGEQTEKYKVAPLSPVKKKKDVPLSIMEKKQAN